MQDLGPRYPRLFRRRTEKTTTYTWSPPGRKDSTQAGSPSSPMKKSPHVNLSPPGAPDHGHSVPTWTVHGGGSEQEMPEAPRLLGGAAMLRVLEEKGQVRHEEEALRYVFIPTGSRTAATRSAVAHLVETFFEGSNGTGR